MSKQHQLAGMKFLVVDDDSDHRRLALRILNTYGAASVAEAKNGVEALEQALTGTYDVVFMDLAMPEMDGLEATRILRSDGYEGAIVALSGSRDAKFIRMATAAGCDDYLIKPLRHPISDSTLNDIALLTHKMVSSARAYKEAAEEPTRCYGTHSASPKKRSSRYYGRLH